MTTATTTTKPTALALTKAKGNTLTKAGEDFVKADKNKGDAVRRMAGVLVPLAALARTKDMGGTDKYRDRVLAVSVGDSTVSQILGNAFPSATDMGKVLDRVLTFGALFKDASAGMGADKGAISAAVWSLVLTGKGRKTLESALRPALKNGQDIPARAASINSVTRSLSGKGGATKGKGKGKGKGEGKPTVSPVEVLSDAIDGITSIDVADMTDADRRRVRAHLTRLTRWAGSINTDGTIGTKATTKATTTKATKATTAGK